MGYFIEIAGLTDLERQGDWESARLFLEREWASDINDADICVRLLSECWYVLVNWDCHIKNEGLNYNTFKSALIGATNVGAQRFGDNSKFLCVAGAMMHLFPFLFYDDADGNLYDEYEQKGAELVRKAVKADENDVVAKGLWNLENSETLAEVNRKNEPLYPQLAQQLAGDGVVEQYFSKLLTTSVH